MEGWRQKYDIRFLLSYNQLCKCKVTTINEIISHTVQAKNKGCVSHTILNHYLFRTYKPSFWGNGLAYHAFISANKNKQVYNKSLDNDKIR